jgi:hypothetical protein
LNILEEILEGYPFFMSRDEDSNHVKYHSIIAEQYRQFMSYAKLIEMSNDLDRPIKIWKVQAMAKIFDIHYEVKMGDIKSVKLFQDGEVPVLLQSIQFDEGVHYYSNVYHGNSPTIIPTSKYYLEIVDHHDNYFVKGFPENSEVLGDKYDHDRALDVLGDKLGIERRKYVEDIPEEDLPFTYPTYCNDLDECDKSLEERIRLVMEYYSNKPLPSVELFKHFGILPVIEGRWRHICKQNKGKQNIHYMRTDNWNSSVYNVTANLDDIPKNIDIPTGDVIQSIIDRSISLGRKAFFTFISPSLIAPEVVSFTDQYFSRIIHGINRTPFVDNYFASVSTVLDAGVGLYDKLKIIINQGRDESGIHDHVTITAIDRSLVDTDADFNGGNHNCTYVEGSGSNAKVRLDTGEKTSVKYPTGWDDWDHSNGSDDFGFINHAGIQDDNVNNYAYAPAGGSGWTFWMRGKDFNHNVPANAKILNFRVDSKHRNTGPYHGFKAKVFFNEVAWIFQWLNWNGDWKDYDSNVWIYWEVWSNHFGINPNELTPAMVNTMMASFSSSLYTSGNRADVDFIRTVVWWRYKSGEYITKTITAPENGYIWDKSIPDGCGIKYDILKASDNSILLADQTGPEIDISGIDYVDIKVKVKFTSDLGASPSVDSISVKNKRHYN